MQFIPYGIIVYFPIVFLRISHYNEERHETSKE